MRQDGWHAGGAGQGRADDAPPRSLPDGIAAWDATPERLRLDEGEVHVHALRLDHPPDAVARFRRNLAPDELRRAEAHRFEREQHRGIVARGALRALLAGYLECAPDELGLRAGPYGKPSIEPSASRVDLRFNVSHAGGRLLVAVTLGRELGIDLEVMRDDLDPLVIARRFFSPSERRELEALPPEARKLAFFACWTRKEAYLKALGDGLSLSLDSFDVPASPDTPPTLLRQAGDPDARERWTFYDLRPGLPFLASLVVAGGPLVVRCWRCEEA